MIDVSKIESYGGGSDRKRGSYCNIPNTEESEESCRENAGWAHPLSRQTLSN